MGCNRSDILNLRGVTVVAPTKDPDDVKLMVRGCDQTELLIKELGVDDFEVCKSGEFPEVAVFFEDHDQHQGDYCAFFLNSRFASVFWSQSTGFEF